MDKETMKEAMLEALEEFEARKVQRAKEGRRAAREALARKFAEQAPLRARALQWALLVGLLAAVGVFWLVPWPGPMNGVAERVAMASFVGLFTGVLAYFVALGVLEWRRERAKRTYVKQGA